MTSKVLVKKSSVTGKTPLVTDLDYGELALNYADSKLFFKKADNTIGTIGGTSIGSSLQTRYSYTATSGQTTFSATYYAPYVDVYINGLRLSSGNDYTASDGNTVVLTSGAILNDLVEIVGLTSYVSNAPIITGGTIDNSAIGTTTASTVRGTTITATTQFTGPGTGLTGTAASLTAGTATALTTARTIALTGDATASGSFDGSANYSQALTLATVNSNTGSFGSATAIPVLTVNSKGLITAVSTTAVSIPSGALTFTGDVTGTGTTGSSTTLTISTSVVTNAMLAGSIANAKLANSSTTIGTTSIALGASATTITGLTSVTSTNFVGALTGNVTGNVTGSAGTVTSISGNTLTSLQVTTGLGFTPYNSTNPSGYTNNTGTVTSVGGTGTVNGLTLTGTVTTSGNLTLGGTLSGIANSATTATNANTASAIVARDASGNFSAGTITAALSGNASTATTATNVSGGSVSATTGTFSGLIKADGGTTQVGSSGGTYRQFRYDGTISADGTNFYALLNSNNYTSYAPSLTGSGASGSWGINVTGSSASCTGTAAGNLPLAGGTMTGQITTRVTTGTTPIVSGGGSNALQVMGDTSNAAWMSFHRGGAYAVNLGIDTSNVVALGGWSDGATYRWTADTAGNFTARGTVAGTNITAGGNTTGTAANATTAGGLAIASGTNNVANQIVRTDGNGYIQAGWINSISGDNGVTTIARVTASSDAYLRYYTPANFNKAMDRTVCIRETNGGTLVAGNIYSIYTGGGAVGMYLPTPANTAAGDTIRIVNLLNTWSSANPFYVYMNGSTQIMGDASTMTCNINAGGFTLVCNYNDGTARWSVLAG